MLLTIDRISRTNPFFTQNFSMYDIDSLPDMYETMIDRPAFIYDSISNITLSMTKNLTKFCSFFINQLNYTNEQCQEIFNNTVIDINQVRINRRNLFLFYLYEYIYFQQRKKRDLKVGEDFAVIRMRNNHFLNPLNNEYFLLLFNLFCFLFLFFNLENKLNFFCFYLNRFQIFFHIYLEIVENVKLKMKLWI